MRPDRPADLLHDVLDFIDRIDRWTLQEPAYAVLHALQCIGEASSRLPSDVMNLAPAVPWAKIRGMRNIIVHNYTGIDRNIVQQTVRQWLPELREAVEAILQRLAPS